MSIPLTGLLSSAPVNRIRIPGRPTIDVVPSRGLNAQVRNSPDFSDCELQQEDDWTSDSDVEEEFEDDTEDTTENHVYEDDSDEEWDDDEDDDDTEDYYEETGDDLDDEPDDEDDDEDL